MPLQKYRILESEADTIEAFLATTAKNYGCLREAELGNKKVLKHSSLEAAIMKILNELIPMLEEYGPASKSAFAERSLDAQKHGLTDPQLSIKIEYINTCIDTYTNASPLSDSSYATLLFETFYAINTVLASILALFGFGSAAQELAQLVASSLGSCY